MHTQQIYVAGVDWTGGVSSAWTTFINWVPKFIGFLAVLIIGWIVAKIIGKVVEKVLRRVGFERAMERTGAAQYLERSKYDAAAMCGLIAKYVVVLLVLQIAFGVFGSNPISRVIFGVIAWIPRGLVALAIVVVTAMIARVVRDLVGNALSSLSYGKMLANIAALCIVVLGAFAALGQAGIATFMLGPLLNFGLAAIAGVIIVGVGGGLIRPMQQRWERMLTRAEAESTNMRAATGSTTRAMPGSAEAYAAGRTEGSQAAAEAARDARQEPPTGAGGSVGGGAQP